MKFNLEDVQQALEEQKIAAPVVQAVIKRLQVFAEENKEEKLPGSKQKFDFVILLSDPDNHLQGKDLSGWVIQTPVGADHNEILPKIRKAAAEDQAAQKRKKRSFKSVGEAVAWVKRKFWKSVEINIKTKSPVIVITTDNKL